MINRYRADGADTVFSLHHRIELMGQLTKGFMLSVVSMDDEAKVNMIQVPSSGAVGNREQETHHDVVAFLKLFEEATPPNLRWALHLGLTSSDLVDNALMMQLREHLGFLLEKIEKMLAMPTVDNPRAVLRPGRTHGQLAEATSWGHQVQVWRETLQRIFRDGEDLYEDLFIHKSPGATGMNWLSRDFPNDDSFEVRSTQVIPRDFVYQWATFYLRLACHLENLAMLVRAGAREEVGELREGRGRTAVGSSAMPGKSNPINSENVCGLARLARGYTLSIIETTGALWEDRDISNSSVERVAVPDLAHTVEHMLDKMCVVMRNLNVVRSVMADNVQDPRCWVSVIQALIQYFGQVPWSDAADMALSVVGNFDNLEYMYRDGFATLTLITNKAVSDEVKETLLAYQSVGE